MSIAEFSAAMRNQALKVWFEKEAAGGGKASAAARAEYSAKNINTLVNSSSEYRAAEQTAAKTSFVITEDTVRSLLVSLKGIKDPDLLEIETDRIFRLFASKNAGAIVNRKKINVGNGIPAVFFNTISFDSITRLVNNILELNAGELATKFEKGHVVGLATNLLNTTANRIAGIDARGSAGTNALPTAQAKEVLLRELTHVIEYYKKLDFDSANIKPAQDIQLYASASKILTKNGKTKYLVELQPRDVNQRSAKEVQATIGSIRKLFSPGNISDKARLALVDKILENVSEPEFANKLVNLRSSPNLVDMIGIHIAEVIGGKAKDQKYTTAQTLIASKKVVKVNLTELRKVILTEQKKVQNLKNKLSTIPKTIPITKSVSNLQALLQASLATRIKENMGTGNAKNVLNYRSGRFAESAKIERLTMSREGLISVFYSYMRNPYGTFSDGGRQENPKTRNPKTLISKSIRQIGSSLISNTMRAVLV